MNNLDASHVQRQISAMGGYLKTRIKTCKYSKREIARRVDCSVNTVNNVINGNNATITSVLSVAYVMGISAQDLVNGAFTSAGPMPVPTVENDDAVIDTNAVSDHMEESGEDATQTSMRMGVNQEELQEVLDD